MVPRIAAAFDRTAPSVGDGKTGWYEISADGRNRPVGFPVPEPAEAVGRVVKVLK